MHTSRRLPAVPSQAAEAGLMRICYIYPDNFGGLGRAGDAMQPLAIAALLAHTPLEWQASFYDERVEALPAVPAADLVVLSVQTFSAKRAYRLAEAYRAHGIRVIMGGFHPSLLPDEAAAHCDAVVTGDAENIWARVLDDYAAGKLAKRYDGGVCADPASIRFDRRLFSGKAYSRLLPVQLGRGCQYACDFCSVHAFYGDARFMRPAAAILEEIASLPGSLLFFCDDNVLADPAAFQGLLPGLARTGKFWTCQISMEVAGQPGLLAAMRWAGCLAVFIGFETSRLDTLASIGKRSNLGSADYPAVVRAIRKQGILVAGSFVFGYPGDSAISLRAALDFARANRLALCHFNPLFPFPKTRLYDRLAREGRLSYPAWWLADDYRYGQPLFEPQDIGGEELMRACQAARQDFNSLACIAARSVQGGPWFGLRRYLARSLCFWLANLVSRREIRRKHGALLGGGDAGAGR